MKSLSDVLIKKREEKNLTVEQVAFETNISKKYIHALESEDFDVFPAEAYLLGFLRNYSEFLDLEYDSIYSEYKNCLLRDEPTPLDELVGNKKSFEVKPWMIIVPVIAIILAVGVPPLIKFVSTSIENRKEALRKSAEVGPQVIEIDENFTDKRVRAGDMLTLQVGENKLSYFVEDVSADITLKETFKGEVQDITLKLGKETIFTYTDLSNISYEVKILLKDIGGFEDNSAIIKVSSELKDESKITQEIFEISESTNNSDAKVIMTRKRSTEPYSIAINFDGDILFRYQEKGRELKENFYRKGSVLNLDITRSVQIWTSNAGLTKFKINGETLVLGKSGSVHVFTLRWIYYKDKDEYRLEYQKAY